MTLRGEPSGRERGPQQQPGCVGIADAAGTQWAGRWSSGVAGETLRSGHGPRETALLSAGRPGQRGDAIAVPLVPRVRSAVPGAAYLSGCPAPWLWRAVDCNCRVLFDARGLNTGRKGTIANLRPHLSRTSTWVPCFCPHLGCPSVSPTLQITARAKSGACHALRSP